MKKKKVFLLENQFKEIQIFRKNIYSTIYLCVHLPTNVTIGLEKFYYSYPLTDALSKYISFQVLIRKVFAPIFTIQKTYHILRDNSHTIFFTESPEGETVIDLASHGEIPIQSVRYLFFLMAQTLFQIHGKGFSIRNWDPQNFRITYTMIKFIGLSEIVPLADVDNDQKLDWLGTITWMAPEMIKKYKYNRQQADVWCLGLFFYYLLMRETLFSPEDTYRQFEEFEFSSFISAKLKQYEMKGAQSKEKRYKNRHHGPFDSVILDLLSKMLNLDPSSRVTIHEVLAHPFLKPSIPFPMIHLPFELSPDVAEWLNYFKLDPEQSHKEMLLMSMSEENTLSQDLLRLQPTAV